MNKWSFSYSYYNIDGSWGFGEYTADLDLLNVGASATIENVICNYKGYDHVTIISYTPVVD